MKGYALNSEIQTQKDKNLKLFKQVLTDIKHSEQSAIEIYNHISKTKAEMNSQLNHLEQLCRKSDEYFSSNSLLVCSKIPQYFINQANQFKSAEHKKELATILVRNLEKHIKDYEEKEETNQDEKNPLTTCKLYEEAIEECLIELQYYKKIQIVLKKP